MKEDSDARNYFIKTDDFEFLLVVCVKVEETPFHNFDLNNV